MRNDQKTNRSPINVPKELVPLMKAFHAASKEAITALIVEAGSSIYGKSDRPRNRQVPKRKIKMICDLMAQLSPVDEIETLLAAQIIASHMLGMKKLAQSYPEDRKLGLKFLKFSNESLHFFQKRRRGV